MGTESDPRSQVDQVLAISQEAFRAALPAILDQVRRQLAAQVGPGLTVRVSHTVDRTAMEISFSSVLRFRPS